MRDILSAQDHLHDGIRDDCGSEQKETKETKLRYLCLLLFKITRQVQLLYQQLPSMLS